MRIVRFPFSLLCGLILLIPQLLAQDKPAADAKNPSAVLKLQVTIGEQDGDKKVANLPYSFFLRANEAGHQDAAWAKLRMGSRVPVYVGKDGGMQYLDVGTNIDARAFTPGDGRFDVYLNLERSWVEGDVLVRALGASESPQYKEPIIRQFKTELTLTMHDGQTVQSTQATDPLSGRVLTITVNLSVVK